MLAKLIKQTCCKVTIQLKLLLITKGKKLNRGARKMNLLPTLVEFWLYDSWQLCIKKVHLWAPLWPPISHGSFSSIAGLFRVNCFGIFKGDFYQKKFLSREKKLCIPSCVGEHLSAVKRCKKCIWRFNKWNLYFCKSSESFAEVIFFFNLEKDFDWKMSV